MHENDRIFIWLGRAINILALVALLVLVARAFEPAFAGLLHGPMTMMQGGGTTMRMGSGATGNGRMGNGQWRDGNG